MLLNQMDAQGNAPKIQGLLTQALTEAQRLQLPEAEIIESWIKRTDSKSAD